MMRTRTAWKVRGLRPGSVAWPGDASIRGGGKRRLGAPAPLREGVPDSQDALHICATARRPARGGPSSWQGLRDWRSTASRFSGTNRSCSCPPGGVADAADHPYAMKLGASRRPRDFASVRTIMARHPEVEWWVTVGDLADERGAYERRPRCCTGSRQQRQPRSRRRTRRWPASHPETCATSRTRARAIRPDVVVGLGGTFAPTGTNACPRPAQAEARPTPPGEFPRLARDDKRRHFLRVEVEAASACGTSTCSVA